MTNTTETTESFDARMLRERQQRIAKVSADVAKFNAIAGLLGATVTRQADTDESWHAHASFTLPCGACVFVRNGKGDKLDISPIWPQEEVGNYQTIVRPSDLWGDKYKDVVKGDHSISVSNTKIAEQIARDITRRMLPDYLPAWHACKGLVDERLNYSQGRTAMVERFAKLAVGDNRGESVYMGNRPGLSYGMLQSFSPDSQTMTLELHGVSADKASAILASLNGGA